MQYYSPPPPSQQNLHWLWHFGIVSLLLATAALMFFWDSSTSEQPADAMMRQADALHEAGQAKQAIALLNTVLTTNPEAQREIYRRIGAIHQSTGRPQEAIPYLEKAIRLGSDEETVKRLVHAQVAIDQDAKALALIDGMAGGKDDPEMRILRQIVTATQPNDPEATRKNYQALLKDAPGNRDLWRRLGRLEMEAGHWSEVSSMMGEALALFPDDLAFLRMDGEAAYLGHDYARSAEIFGRAVKLHPGNGPSPDSVGLARAMIQLGKRDKANELLDAFLAAKPNHVNGLFFRALSAFRDGDYKTAYRHSAYLSSLYPHKNEYKLLAGAAELGLGDVKSAQAYLTVFAHYEPGQYVGRRLLDAALAPQTAEDVRNGTSASLKNLFDEVLR